MIVCRAYQDSNNVPPPTAALVELEQRIADLELGQRYDASQTAVRAVQADLLTQLRTIRAALVAERNQSGTTAASSSALTALQLENEQLKKRNTKLEYRVQHLVSNMEKLLPERAVDV